MQKEISQMLRDFRKDFDLNFAEVAIIAKPEASGFEKRARRMEALRKTAKEVLPQKNLHEWLHAYHKKFGDSPFNLLVNGYFDTVIEFLLGS